MKFYGRASIFKPATYKKIDPHGSWLYKIYKEGKLNEISKSEAKTLLKQLGGGRFLAMTGAKDFGIGKDGLHFKIGRNAKSISHVVINLNSMDTYDIKFLRVRAGKIKIVKTNRNNNKAGKRVNREILLKIKKR